MADGKIFAAEFALRRNVKALDKILIEDSDDGVVKYAFPPQIAALSGYAYADSIADLPEDPVNKTIGYVVGDKFYIYVGEGGNAKDGLYQEVQGFVGPQGIPGPKGDKGDAGDGAIDEAYLANYLQQNQYQTASDVNSALAIYATQAYVTQEINELLGGASGAYDTLKEIEEILKGNVDSIGDLFDVLDTKWTQDNTLIAHWNEAYSWGNHATAGYVAKTYVDSNFVTLATAQTITGEKNFTGGFKVNGGVLEYDASLGTWVFNGNLLVTGGMSAFSNIEGFTPSTITDAVLIDNQTIKRNASGLLYAVAQETDGINEEQLADYLTTNNYAKKSDINSALTAYLPKAGGTITGDFFIKKPGNATIIFQPSDASKSFWFGVNTSEEWYCTNGGYTETYKLIHSGNYRSYPVKNPNALSWSGYSSGSYDGSTAQSIALPTKLSQLTDDVVSGKYLSLAGGTISQSGYWSTKFKSTGQTSSAIAFEVANGNVGYLMYGDGSKWQVTAQNWSATHTLLHSGNYSDYALPLTGGTVGGTIKTTGGIFSGAGLEAYPVGDIYRFRVTADSNYTYVQAGAPDGTKSGLLYFTGYNASVLSRLYIKATSVGTYGNVAIGGTTATEKLHVYGNILATGGITAQNSSDERLKRNIRKFNASKVLMSLRGVYEYEYIDSEVQKNSIYEGTHYGLIYQHVKGTALDVMCHKREDGFGTLNYIHPKFISLIAGATMENISEVEKLKRKIRHLEQKVKQLENRA